MLSRAIPRDWRIAHRSVAFRRWNHCEKFMIDHNRTISIHSFERI
jgi:hypothetical protein